MDTKNGLEYDITAPNKVNDIKALPLVPNKPGYGLIYSDGQEISNPTPFVSPNMSNIDASLNKKIYLRLTAVY